MSDQAPLPRQLGAFVVVGIVAAIVDFGLLVALMDAGLGRVVAKSVSFFFGTATAYALNRRWTFGAEASRRRFAATMVVYALTFVLQVGLFTLTFDTARRAGTSLIVGQALGFMVGQGVATTINFVVQRSVIFRSARRPTAR